MDQNVIVIDEDTMKPGDWLLMRGSEIKAHSSKLADVLNEAKKFPPDEVRIVPLIFGGACYF